MWAIVDFVCFSRVFQEEKEAGSRALSILSLHASILAFPDKANYNLTSPFCYCLWESFCMGETGNLILSHIFYETTNFLFSAQRISDFLQKCQRPIYCTLSLLQGIIVKNKPTFGRSAKNKSYFWLIQNNSSLLGVFALSRFIWLIWLVTWTIGKKFYFVIFFFPFVYLNNPSITCHHHTTSSNPLSLHHH